VMKTPKGQNNYTRLYSVSISKRFFSLSHYLLYWMCMWYVIKPAPNPVSPPLNL
jgi:hypothetical protein